MAGRDHIFSKALIDRLCYCHGFPFITSVILAVVTAAWPRVREALFHQGTSIWTMAMLATVSTAFALLCGGRFRTFFVVIAVTPPFLLVLPWFLQLFQTLPASYDYMVKGQVVGHALGTTIKNRSGNPFYFS